MAPSISHPLSQSAPVQRLDRIQQARHALLLDGPAASDALVAPWIQRSWQRCLGMGHYPTDPVGFDLLPAAAMRRTSESNRDLTLAAQPVLRELGRALAQTRYFAILTNLQGVVVDVNGPIDRSDRRADLITRIGVDLSERSVGTTAIGAALGELAPVWLHRGEHFFDDTSAYSCAGAPLLGPQGECVGMLDLTGIDVPERPELKHLVVRSARAIENLLALQRPHRLLLRVNWPGPPLGDDSDGLIGLDADGMVTTSNSAARAMLPQLLNPPRGGTRACHSSELFAVPFESLFDASHRTPRLIDIPLWSGLHVLALAMPAGASATLSAQHPGWAPQGTDPRRLRDIETALIRSAVDEARGNVALAAKRLGVSRATVYRKLGLGRH